MRSLLMVLLAVSLIFLVGAESQASSGGGRGPNLTPLIATFTENFDSLGNWTLFGDPYPVWACKHLHQRRYIR